MKTPHAHLWLLAFTILLLMPTKLSAAEDGVEVNLDVLENYQPPPMFSGEIIPTKALPPKPNKKPRFSASRIAKAKTAKTPVPRKRPSTMAASSDFVTKARAVKPVEVVKEELPPMQQDKNKYEGIKSSDPLKKKLLAPTAQDVLAQIDPLGIDSIANPPPQPSQIAQPGTGGIVHSAIDKTSLGFQSDVTGLTEDVRQMLRTQFLKRAKKNDDKRIEIRAYASTQNKGESHARRISLSRALAVREFLINSKLDPKRIDIRPLGTNTDEEPINRVDIFLLSRYE